VTAGRSDLAAYARHGLADTRLEQGDSSEAARLYGESLAQHRSDGDRRSGVYCLGGLAAAAASSGDVETAGRLWAAVVQYEHSRGTSLESSSRRRYEDRLGVVDDQSLALAVERGRDMSFEEAVDYALTASNG
jgi:hypothetical protein